MDSRQMGRVNGEDQQEKQYSCWVRNGEMNLQMEKEISLRCEGM